MRSSWTDWPTDCVYSILQACSHICSGGQYHIMISHEVQQQGKLTAAQGHRLSIDLRHPAGRVDVNAPNLKECGLCIYWIVIMIVFGVSPELSADIIGNRCKRGLS